MTVQNIFDKVRFITKLDSNDASDTQLYLLLNDALSEQVKFVASLHEDFLLKNTSMNISNGVSDYSLASDILQLKKIITNMDGTNSYVAYEKDLNLVTELNTTVESSTAPVYSKITNASGTEFQIRLYPTPTMDVSGGLNYWYISRPAQVNASLGASFTPVTPPEVHPALVQMMVRDLKQRDGDYNGMNLAQNQIMMAHQAYKSGVSQRNIDTYEGFVANDFTE